MYRAGVNFNKFCEPTRRSFGFVKYRGTNGAGQARNYGGHGKDVFKMPNMNELPVPSGSWVKHHNRVQQKNNLQLFFGIGFSAFTLFVAKQSNLINFNTGPGKLNLRKPSTDIEEESLISVAPEDDSVQEQSPVAEPVVESTLDLEQTPIEQEPAVESTLDLEQTPIEQEPAVESASTLVEDPVVSSEQNVVAEAMEDKVPAGDVNSTFPTSSGESAIVNSDESHNLKVSER